MWRGSLEAIDPSVCNLRFEKRHSYGLCGLALLLVALLATACAKSEGAGSTDLTESQPSLSIEMPRQDDVRVPFTVSGWAADLAALEGSGIDVVQIVDEGCEGAVIGIAEYGLERPDIEMRYGEQFRYSGWRFEVERLRSGDHTLAVRTRSSEGDEYNHCQVVQITVK